MSETADTNIEISFKCARCGTIRLELGKVLKEDQEDGFIVVRLERQSHVICDKCGKVVDHDIFGQKHIADNPTLADAKGKTLLIVPHNYDDVHNLIQKTKNKRS